MTIKKKHQYKRVGPKKPALAPRPLRPHTILKHPLAWLHTYQTLALLIDVLKEKKRAVASERGKEV